MRESAAFRQRLYERYASTHAARGADVEASEAGRRPYHDRLIRQYFPVERAARILDLGCGDGLLLRSLGRHGYSHVRGVDTSPEQVERAAARGSVAVCGNLIDVLAAAPDTSEDVVIAFDVLEHFTKSEALEVADEVFRVLRPGGRFIVHVPNGMALLGAPSYFSDMTHELCFTADSMRQFMAVAGFRDVHIAEDTPTVHGAKSAVRWVLWQVIRQGARFAHAVETGAWADGVYSQNLLALGFK